MANRQGGLKIVHIISGLGVGGAERTLCRLVTAQEYVADSIVISFRPKGPIAWNIEESGVPVISLNATTAWAIPFAFVRLMLVLRRLQPDVVQTWMYHADLIGGVAAWLLRIPVVWGIRHSDLTSKDTKLSTRIIAKICALLSTIVPGAIVSCSRKAAEAHVAIGYAQKFFVIHNGIDTSTFRSAPSHRVATRNHLQINDCKVIGTVGRAHPLKDYGTLVSSFERVARSSANARLLLVGSGLEPDSDALKRLLAGTSLHGRVCALGLRDDIPDLISAMDVFVLSSRSEAFPNVVVEAMACGVPCVVTDVGDAAEIVGTTGWVCEPGDSIGIANAIESCLNENERERSVRAHASMRRANEMFALDRMVCGYWRIWSGLANSKCGARAQ